VNKDNIIGATLDSLGNALLLATVILGIGVLFNAMPMEVYLTTFTSALLLKAVGDTVSTVHARRKGRER
jgi:hypothetical protein